MFGKKGGKILKLPSVRNCFTLVMTTKLVVIINSLKVPKIKKFLLYEISCVPNYSCLRNPWLGGYRPQIPVLAVLCPQLNLLNPTPWTKFLGTPLPTSKTEVQCDAFSEWNAAENRTWLRIVTGVKSTRVWRTTGRAVREFRCHFQFFPIYCHFVIRKRRMSCDSKLRVPSAKEPTTAPGRLDQRKYYEKGASGIDLTTLRILRRLVKLFPALVLPNYRLPGMLRTCFRAVSGQDTFLAQLDLRVFVLICAP